MTITIIIDPAVESVGIQTIATALGVTGTDADCKGHLALHLKKIVAELYVRGDEMKRTAAAASVAVNAAASYITSG